MDTKAPDAFRTISEVADELDLPQHVLRFWESRFREIKPLKRGGGRRYYRPDDVDLLRGIRHLLYGEGYTIRGVQRILREQGGKFVEVVWQEGAQQPPHGAGSEDDEAMDDAAPPEELNEAPGLRGRLSSLIGRDIGDRADDAQARRDPPLQSAPMPRIEAEDRAIHTGAIHTGADEPVAPPVPSARVPVAAAPATSELGRAQMHKLHAALHELGECRKLLDAALARA